MNSSALRPFFTGSRRLLPLIGITLALSGCGGDGDVIPPFNSYEAIVVGDLDGDGRLDIAVAGSFISGPPPHPGFVSVILQNPATPGSFLAGVHYPAGRDPFSLAAGDLNGDDRLDLAAASTTLNVGGTAPKPLTVLFQAPASPGTFLPAVSLPAGVHNDGVALGDLNADGRNDLAVATCDSGVLLFLQSAPGAFSPPVTVSGGTCAADVAIGDLDGDGRPDLAVAYSAGSVSILLQDLNNPGSFLPAGSHSAGQQPIALKIAELNNDGLADIVVANLGSPFDGNTASVSVLLQNPVSPGSFLPAVNHATGFRSADVAAGDLNGDGRPDLVVANWGALGTTGSVSVLLQDPVDRGIYLPRQNYPGLFMPTSVAIGDLDGDGRPDIAVADDGAAVMFGNPAAPGHFFPSLRVGH